MKYPTVMPSGTKKKVTTKGGRGGARPGAGRKSAEELGTEKVETIHAYLYPSEQKKLYRLFPDRSKEGKVPDYSAALRSLIEKKK